MNVENTESVHPGHLQQSTVHVLRTEDVSKLAQIATSASHARGAEFYAWRNAPEYDSTRALFTHSSGWGPDATTRDISPEEALDIYKAKLDGAYGERFLLTVATIAALVQRGSKVSLLQLSNESGVPFDAHGWVVVSIDGHPMFHISPDDLPLEDVQRAGLISVLHHDSPEAKQHGWKGTTKLDEVAHIFSLLNGTDTAQDTSSKGPATSGIHYVTHKDFPTLTAIALQAAEARGTEFYSWKNPPVYDRERGVFTHTTGWGDSQQTREISPQEALEVYKSKLDCAYGERFLLTISAVRALLNAGCTVALLQLTKEPGIPFDANGWIVVSVNGYPMFHISPNDLPLQAVQDAGLISVLHDDSPAAKEHGWKGTNKPQEFDLILGWSSAPRPPYLSALQTQLADTHTVVPESQLAPLRLAHGVKCLVKDPLHAAEIAGGVTFEKGRGWWTFTKDARVARQLGGVVEEPRSALYIPTLRKNGEPVDLELIEQLQEEIAHTFGLRELTSASGVWILSETGEPQLEYIWIAHGMGSQDPQELRAFAEHIRQVTNQDSVAYEVDGELRFTPDLDSPTDAIVLSNAEAELRYATRPGVDPNAARLWVIPNNDAEAQAAINLLLAAGESVLISHQGWGASWKDLEPSLSDELNEWRARNPGKPIYGLELRGENSVGAIDIDDHSYPGDDRTTNTYTRGLIDIAQIVGVPLSRFEKLICANDQDYRRGMVREGATPGEISVVRAMDRSAQGVSASDQNRAAFDVSRAEFREGPAGSQVILQITTPSETPQLDLIADSGRNTIEQLCVSASGIDYYGPRYQEFKRLGLRSKSNVTYEGGDGTRGYFGIKAPTDASQQRILEFFRDGALPETHAAVGAP